MASLSSQQITGLLVRWGQGDEQALDALVPVVYNRLRRLAAYLLHGERSGHTLQPTALVNEAYLKLAGQARFPWENRAHFFAVAGRAMRQILVDYARHRRREKRGGGVSLVPLEEHQAFVGGRGIDLLALDQALHKLAEDDKRKALVVELRYFGGLSNEEIAKALQISVNTVTRDWDFARAWLNREMSGNSDGRGDRSKAAKKG